MTDAPIIAVTGATGGVGGDAARRLGDAGARTRLLCRDPSRLPDVPGSEPATFVGYGDADSAEAALRGASSLFLVSGREAPDRVGEHRTMIDAAVRAGVERIVYLSFLGAAPDCTFTFGRDHFHTERALADSGLRWTALRDAWYQEYLPMMAGSEGVLRGPAGDGRASAVSPDDIADSAAAVLRSDDPAHDGRTYDITGPEALSMAQVAEILTEASGRPVRYEDETLEEAYASRSGYDAPAFEVEGWVTSYVAVATGELSTVSGDVLALTGHEPERFADFLARRPDVLEVLR